MLCPILLDAVVEPILNLKNESGDDGGGDRERYIRRRSIALEILLAR